MRVLRLLLAVALAAAGSGCAEPQADVVLARVGVPWRAASVRPALESTPRRLGTHTRNALKASAQGFEVDVPAEATRLAFSTAVVGPQGPLRLRVSLRSGASASWQTLAEPPAGAGDWQDQEIALPAVSAARTLRFHAEGDASGEALWGSILLLGPGDAPAARPSVLLVSLDTLGADYLGSFSDRRDVSPHLDAFLAESASFRRAHAQYGNTLVSHASLFGALYPRHHGVYGGVGAMLKSSLVETLAQAGYRTVAFTEGGFVSAAFGFGRGFDAYDDGTLDVAGHAQRGASQTFARAANWLGAHAGEQSFVFLHSYEVHSPYLPRDAAALEVAARSTPGDARVFSPEEQARQRHLQPQGKLAPADLARLAALYLGEIHTLDAAVGDLLARLSAQGLAGRTLVVVTADHGEQFGEWGRMGHGQSLHNRVLRVPLGLRWPGVIRPAVLDAPVQLVDVMPTLLDLIGLPAPAGLDGRSLAPLLTGQTAPDGPRPAFSEQGNDDVECAQPDASEQCHHVDRVAVQTERFKLVSSRYPAWTRLYDLASDPHEQRDVAAEWPDEVRRLSLLIDAYRGGAAALPASPEAAAPAVDADTLRRLRDLGYLEEPGANAAPSP